MTVPMIISPILIVLIVCTSLFGIIYVFVSARKKERLALIEKGTDASIFIKDRDPESGKYQALMFGILFIGLGLGVFGGAVIDEWGMFPGPASYFATILLFGGISLVIYYFILNRLTSRKQNTELEKKAV